MRSLKWQALLVYFVYLFIVLFLTFVCAQFSIFNEWLWLGLSILIFYFFALIGFRLWLFFCNFETGYIDKNSKAEFYYQVYVTIKLFLFNPLIDSSILPTPILTLLYYLMGLRLGKHTYISGNICDPHFVEIGSHSFTGYRSILVPHIMEDEELGHFKIRIGSHVTIGTGATVLAGTEIEDFAIVAAQSLVLKNTKIAKYEIWGGVPAKKIGVRKIVENSKLVS